MENTNEEEILDDESVDESENEDQNVENDSKESETTEHESKEKPEDDVKEQNRKGYEIRQKNKQSEKANEVEELKARLNEIESSTKADRFLSSHPEVSDDEFLQIKAQAEATGKSFEDVMNTPIFKEHFERKERVERTNRATPSPSTKGSVSSGNKNAFEQSSEEFQARLNNVMNQ